VHDWIFAWPSNPFFAGAIIVGSGIAAVFSIIALISAAAEGHCGMVLVFHCFFSRIGSCFKYIILAIFQFVYCLGFGILAWVMWGAGLAIDSPLYHAARIIWHYSFTVFPVELADAQNQVCKCRLLFVDYLTMVV